ncbi:hypothetical protein acsn021_04580 [Anaerocolumna cellulosilytica]|uniref:Uncharacterized protein n=2 Tax=Anaerocolumna cellulosilytica TaxID=433286 RepID=A0A6S6QUY9_9FIRM|nr:hypothetical protein [Anaerocolumna cellulosilytica]BCJ92889.1 hypothetical protein acsn021_04580 [Anaerocolumna cellulosilytica]
MYFNYCCNCTTKECTYSSTKNIFELLLNDNYEFAGCPDKEDAIEVQKLLLKMNPNRKPYILNNSSHCTADIRLMNKLNEEIYLEIKRIPFGFESNKEIGSSKALERIVFLISEIFNTYEEHADFIRKNYTICIKNGYICEFDKENFDIEDYIDNSNSNTSEISLFISEFINYVYDNKSNLDKFTFSRNRIPIEIIFKSGLPFNSATESSSPSDSTEDCSSSNVDLHTIELLNVIIQLNDFYFEIPANNSNKINMHEYLKLITDPTPILTQVIKNLDKAKNSFYGIERGRYVIQEIFFKIGNDALYSMENDSVTPIGQQFYNNMITELTSVQYKINEYKNYYDKCFLFFTLGDSTYRSELF